MSDLQGAPETGLALTKIRREHLKRNAIVYIRQSTIEQVESNVESKKRQYGLVDRALSLGWADALIEVIDEDQGKSAAQTTGRHGFSRLVAKIGMGEVGIVLGLEVSRLARNNQDWYHLLDLCALFNTLIADNDGIYDPRLFNDRLLLGLKGTMSEAELHIMHNRLTAGLENKAKRGELVLGLPVGFCRSDEGGIEHNPNELVQQSINTVFEKFRAHGSVFTVLRALREEEILSPFRRDVMGPKDVEWRPATYKAVHSILTNPIYAGVYSFGRTGTTKKLTEDGRVRKSRGIRLNRTQWPVLITEHHPSYITWVEYEENQKRIESNSYRAGHPGAIKGGASLLSGLVRCGICGRSMSVVYTGTKNNCPRFLCHGDQMLTGGARCQSFGARRLEERITVLLLSVLEPRALEAALMALEDFETDRQRQVHRLELEVERAAHAEERARRHFENVEPENRLVARELEKRWETALVDLEGARRVKNLKIAALPSPLTDEEKNELRRSLGQLPALWRSHTTKPEDRKEIARLLIHHVEARVETSKRKLQYAIHWVTGHVTSGSVKLPRTGEHRWTTPDNDLEMIRNLAQDHSDVEIAAELTRAGRITPHGLPWTESRVRSVRMAHKIMKPKRPPEHLIGCMETRRILRINYKQFRQLVVDGKLKATQAYPYARWRVPREDVELLASQL